MQLVICPKCGSESIEEKWLNAPPVEHITIDEYVESLGKPVTLVYKQRNYRLTCRECGYSREFSRL